MRWSVLRNFRVITETTPKQLSLKLPPATAAGGRGALKAPGMPRRDRLRKVTGPKLSR